MGIAVFYNKNYVTIFEVIDLVCFLKTHSNNANEIKSYNVLLKIIISERECIMQQVFVWDHSTKNNNPWQLSVTTNLRMSDSKDIFIVPFYTKTFLNKHYRHVHKEL